MTTALISVIVPVYNLEKELPRCLESILAQTYKNIEIIVVDDGSSNGSNEIIKRYAAADERVKPIFQANGGVTSARLHGVREAIGDWIGFVDGDDEIERDMYERLLVNAEKYNADISHCGYQMVFADGRVNYFHNTGLLAKQDKTTALKELLSGSMVEPGLWNKLFRKNLLHSLFHSEALPQEIKINEDLLMNYRLFTASEWSVFEDRCPYHYIVRSGSASRASLNEHKIYDPIRVKDIIRRDAPDAIRDDAQRAYVNTCINICHTLMASGVQYRNDLKKVRGMLKHERRSFRLLGKKRAVMAKLISYVPLLYKPIYSFYCRFFQKNVYL